LVDIHSRAENDFVRDFFTNDPNLCPDVTNPKKCKYKGWIGFNDEEVENTFVWTTGVTPTFLGWPLDGEGSPQEPADRKGNLDHTEIGADGVWSIVNGASSTNEGYFVEWEVVWPDTPPF
jgi:hypothetical protein